MAFAGGSAAADEGKGREVVCGYVFWDALIRFLFCLFGFGYGFGNTKMDGWILEVKIGRRIWQHINKGDLNRTGLD